MSAVTLERRLAARTAESTGWLLMAVGCVGVIAAAVITVWTLHDLFDSDLSGQVGTITKLSTITSQGLVPIALSLILVGVGQALRVLSTWMLFGAASLADFDDDDLDEVEAD